MLAFQYDGDAYFTLQYDGNVLDTAQGLDSWILQPPPTCTNYAYFHTATSNLVDGVVLTGQTSAAVIRVMRVVTTKGTLAGNDGAGVIFFDKLSGNIASGENLRVGVTTYCVAGSAAIDAPVGQRARSIFVSAETNGIRFAIGGMTPTTSTGTPASWGALLPASSNMVISGWHDVAKFVMVHAVAASNAVVSVIVRF